MDLIGKDWKISQVLGRYPDLLEVLVGLSPAFEKLRNPVLRKVQARLVTVEQAARIAGMDPDDLVRRLNASTGLTPGDFPRSPSSHPGGGGEAQSLPPPPWVSELEGRQVEELDVRPILQAGGEPFSRIMQLASRIEVGAAFRLIANFEPVPLYEALAPKGFDHWTRRVAEDRWEVLFYRASRPGASALERPWEPDWDEVDAVVNIDVSELVPPEPMVKILRALEELPPGSTLRVHHHRRPMFLYPRLDELGYPHRTRELESGQVEILIHKPAGGEA